MSQKELDCQLRDAAHEGNLGRLKELLDASADPRATSSFGRTPLHWACCNGHDGCIAPLLAADADPNAADSADWTPLHLACRYGHAACIAPLLRAGADPRAEDNYYGWTPLRLACHYGRGNCIAPLLSRGADMSAVDRGGRTPRALAEERNDERGASCIKALDAWQRQQVGKKTKPARRRT